MRLRIALHFVAIGLVGQASAQDDFAFSRWDTVVVSLAAADTVSQPIQLANPWVGGMTSPQFSSADLNFDGAPDLFVFDRGGDRVLPFLSDPSIIDEDGAPRYTYAPNLRSAFPQGLKNWALLADANCDGRADLFTNYQSGVRLWYDVGEGAGSGGEDLSVPAFMEPTLSEKANWNFGAGSQTLPMVCLSTDIPALLDMDDDGDLDLVTWTETSSTLYAYTGRGAEPGTIGCGDTLVWDVTNRCYGMLNEASETNQLYIGNEHECAFNVVDPRSETEFERGRHAGGTAAMADLDGDGHKDLLLGDVSYHSMIAAYLVEAVDGQDSTANQSSAFPADQGAADTINVRRFPAAFPLDVDHDGDRDLLICPNAIYEVDGTRGATWFKNVGTNTSPTWTLVRDNFLHRTMIDVGRGAYPAFTDFNADGLTDLVVANKERYFGPGQTPCSLTRFENVGSAEIPAFLRVDTNWLDLSAFGIESAVPYFGDLDGDGDEDLLLGDELGKVYHFKNVAAAGQLADYQLIDAPIVDADGNDIDVGQFAAPALIDLDADGDLDLVVGEKNGNLNCYMNTGDPVNFEFALLTETLGAVHADNVLGINGFATICWHQTDTARWLLLGNELGRIQRFEMPAASDWQSLDPETAWAETHEDWGALREGGFAAPAMADLDADGIHDLVAGFRGGGLVLWRGGDFSTGLNELAWPNMSEGLSGWVPAPNPVRAGTLLELQWHVSGGEVAVPELSKAVWISSDGRTVWQEPLDAGQGAGEQGTVRLMVPLKMKQGLYTLRLGAQTLRIVVE